MVQRTRALLAGLLLASAGPAVAQATGDQSRLAFSVYGGYIPGKQLWRVAGQPLVDDVLGTTDALGLTRDLESSWTAGLGVTFFRGANIGLTADLSVLDTRLRDTCSPLSSSGSPVNPEICASINGAVRSTLSTTFSVGAIFRVASRAAASPYLRAQGGIFLINKSSTSMTGFYVGDDQLTRFMDIYLADGNSSVSAQFAVGAGLTIPIAKAYHLRLEGRGTTYGVPVVTGPTARQFTLPPTETRYRTQFSLLVGMDLVLERKHGRRY